MTKRYVLVEVEDDFNWYNLPEAVKRTLTGFADGGIRTAEVTPMVEALNGPLQNMSTNVVVGLYHAVDALS